MSRRPRRVVVVGGGAGGVITAASLLRRAAGTPDDVAVDVTVVERRAATGPGLAYSTRDPHHLLNNYAGRMSAFEDDEEHFVRWCRAQGLTVGHDTFVSRETYGRYLADLLDDQPVPAGSSLARLRDDVVDVTHAGDGYLVTTVSGQVLAADDVVLALGNPPPQRPRGGGLEAVPDERYAADPWDPALLERVGPHDRVLLVGTGLTTVDVSAQLASSRPGVRVTAVSRHGLLPLHHVPEAPGPAHSFDVDVDSLAGALHEARRCLDAGAEWRCVVESVKHVFNDVWGALALEDKERFTRHVARRWEIARHRMAPAMAEIVDDLLATGRLTVARSGDVDPASYDLVVNCTGPSPVSAPGWNPLVDSLAVKGMLWPGPCGLGVDVDTDGALLDADGIAAAGLYAVGAARRGVEWECAAVPDIRRQAQRLAAHLCVPRAEPTALAG